jgi:hypothetical protein
MEVLYKTRIGSRLHGLSHDNSDHDWYTVVNDNFSNKKRNSTHTIVDGTDSVVVGFGTWLVDAVSGSPQALEAMFSRTPEFDRVVDLRNSFVYAGSLSVYEDLIRLNARSDKEKARRHAMRLALNGYDLGRYGRFDPTLSEYHRQFVINNMNAYDVEYLAFYVFHNGWDAPMKGNRNVLGKA